MPVQFWGQLFCSVQFPRQRSQSMDFCVNLGLAPVTVLRWTVQFLLMTTLTSSLPAHMTSSPSTSPSHMKFMMAVKVQILPKTEFLTNYSEDLLRTQCNTADMSISECFKHAERLDPIQGLEEFPSKSVLEKEGTSVFSKHLFKDALRMMVRLEKMVKLESSDSDRDSQYEEEKMAELESSDSDSDRQYEDYEDYDDVVDEMEAAFARAITSAREMLGEELESYFGTRKLASTGRLRKARRHYVSAHSKHDYLVKLYYTAWERFKQITFALDYAAQLIMSDVKSASSRS